MAVTALWLESLQQINCSNLCLSQGHDEVLHLSENAYGEKCDLSLQNEYDFFSNIINGNNRFAIYMIILFKNRLYCVNS